MATITLSSGFDVEDFWEQRSGAPLTMSSTTYEYVTADGSHVRVSGVGLTYSGNDPSSGYYSSITVVSATTQTVATYSTGGTVAFGGYFSTGEAAALSGNDTITGSSDADTILGLGGNDTLIGGGGVDYLDGGAGSDTYVFSSNSDVGAGEQIVDSGADGGTDTLKLAAGATSVHFNLATVLGIEALTFTGAQTAYFTDDQLPSDFLVTGASGTAQQVSVTLTDTSFSAAGWTFANWDSSDSLVIIGTSSADTITGSSGNDIIAGLGGADHLDGGNGSDTYQFSGGNVAAGEVISDTGTTGVDTLKLFDNVNFTGATTISGIEALAFTGGYTATFNGSQFGAGQLPANLAVTGVDGLTQTIVVQNAHDFSAAGWTFSNWEATDTLKIYGTAGDDTITGSVGNDVIYGGGGNDVIHGGGGSDTLILPGAGGDYTESRTSDGTGWVIKGSGGTTTVYDVSGINFAGDSSTLQVSNLIGTQSDTNSNPNAVNENSANGTLVGITAHAVDGSGDAVTYSLTDNAGGRFAIDQTTGIVSVANGSLLDYEQASSEGITVRATSTDQSYADAQYTIAIGNVNEAPTNVTLSKSSLPENSAAGTIVGSLTATDPDAGDSETFSLVSNPGNLFAINGNNIVVMGALDYETATSHDVTVEVTDRGGLTLDKVFTIGVTNVNEAPTAIHLSRADVPENSPHGTVVGSLSAVDPDAGDSFTFSLTSDPGNYFAINGNNLVVSGPLDYETATSHDITVRVTDHGGLSFNENLTIAIDNVSPETITGTSNVTSATGNNTLTGGNDNDYIYASGLAPIMTGGRGADHFIFTALSQSRPAWHATITDFDLSSGFYTRAEGDKIDLTGLERSLHEHLHFVKHPLHGSEIKGLVGFDAKHHMLELDKDGNGTVDFEIAMPHVNHLFRGDLIL